MKNVRVTARNIKIRKLIYGAVNNVAKHTQYSIIHFSTIVNTIIESKLFWQSYALQKILLLWHHAI